MGWRFRKSFALAPGLRLNLGRRGITSMSVGRRGATVNLGKRGVNGTVSIPGTGLSYQHRFMRLPTGRQSTQANPAAITSTNNPATSGGRAVSGRMYLIIAIVLVLGCLALVNASRGPRSGREDQSGTQSRVLASQPGVTIGPSAAGTFATMSAPPPQAKEAAEGSSAPAIREATIIQAANVRAAPSLSGAVITVLPGGTSVQLLQSEHGWFRVRERPGEALGWVHGSLLR